MLGNGFYSSEQISFEEAKPATVSEEFNVTLKTYPPDLCPKRSCLMDATYYCHTAFLFQALKQSVLSLGNVSNFCLVAYVVFHLY